MIDFPSQYSIQPFDAEVTACIVQTISSNNGYINDRAMLWGDDVLRVDATMALSGFTQYPNCGYAFNFAPKLVTDNGLVNFPVANSASFSNSLGTQFF